MITTHSPCTNSKSRHLNAIAQIEELSASHSKALGQQVYFRLLPGEINSMLESTTPHNGTTSNSARSEV